MDEINHSREFVAFFFKRKLLQPPGGGGTGNGKPKMEDAGLRAGICLDRNRGYGVRMDWTSTDAGYPPDNAEVWTWDGARVRIGSFVLADVCEAEADGFWTDETGAEIEPTHWLPRESSLVAPLPPLRKIE